LQCGENPLEKVSTDSNTKKLLGYKWDSKKDELSPSLGELNLNKKQRGNKKPNLEPVKRILDTKKLLTCVKLTQSMIVGKVSDFFYPCGFFKPVKLQNKLQTRTMKGKKWDMQGYVDLPKVKIPRFCLPRFTESQSQIRLICSADATEFKGRQPSAQARD